MDLDWILEEMHLQLVGATMRENCNKCCFLSWDVFVSSSKEFEKNLESFYPNSYFLIYTIAQSLTNAIAQSLTNFGFV